MIIIIVNFIYTSSTKEKLLYFHNMMPINYNSPSNGMVFETDADWDHKKRDLWWVDQKLLRKWTQNKPIVTDTWDSHQCGLIRKFTRTWCYIKNWKQIYLTKNQHFASRRLVIFDYWANFHCALSHLHKHKPIVLTDFWWSIITLGFVYFCYWSVTKMYIVTLRTNCSIFMFLITLPLRALVLRQQPIPFWILNWFVVP